MKKRPRQTDLVKKGSTISGYDSILSGIVDLLESARHASARSINTIMTAAYGEVGRRIVEFEQYGKKRAGYGEQLLKQLSADLKQRFGRAFLSIISKPCDCSMLHIPIRRYPRHCLGYLT